MFEAMRCAAKKPYHEYADTKKKSSATKHTAQPPDANITALNTVLAAMVHGAGMLEIMILLTGLCHPTNTPVKVFNICVYTRHRLTIQRVCAVVCALLGIRPHVPPRPQLTNTHVKVYNISVYTNTHVKRLSH